VDFNAVYYEIIKPAIYEADLEPIRADEEQTDGIIQKPMFERLLLCDFAVADLTGANPNVYYELGVRHAQRPDTTIMMFSEATRLPFDVSLLRGFPYGMDEQGNLTKVEADKKYLKERLMTAREKRAEDSPIFQLLENYPDVSQGYSLEGADVFRSQLDTSKQQKESLAVIRGKETTDKKKFAELQAFDNALGKKLDGVDTSVLMDLFLSYRAVGEYQSMIGLVERMPKHLAGTVLVQEQMALALNRMKDHDGAERILLNLIKERGPSSETYGLLGRVYKDKWRNARASGRKLKARGALKKAAEIYLKGYKADLRDAYPGVNAVTMMYINNPEDARLKNILPVVRYAVLREIERKEQVDYWDYATLFELDVLEYDLVSAQDHLEEAVNVGALESWMLETTLANMVYIQEARESRGLDVSELAELAQEMQEMVNDMKKG
ncbi:MAG: TRAFs-binding domain-containing protein, partial [Bacteroidota bacterium]